MAEKKYYWLKLNEGFFRQKEIKKLRRIAGGDTYTIIYLKLLLRSLANNGFLYYEGIEPTFAEELALDIDEDEENVSVTLAFLQNYGILEEKNEVEFLLLTCSEMVGSETAAARRMRNKRDRNKLPLPQEIPAIEPEKRNNVTAERNNVQKCYSDVRERYTEIDIETDKREKRKEPYIELYASVVSYLNEKAGTHYKASSEKTKSLIRARAKEGFTLEDFQAVIDKKCADWLSDPKMNRYLRPETIFGTKFEGYLNEHPKKGSPNTPSPTDEESMKQRWGAAADMV